MYKETIYLNPLEIAQDMTKILKHKEKCDLVICLSHIGYHYKNEPDKICDLKLMPVEIPFLEEQQKIASFLSAIDVQIVGVSKKIDQTKLFKKGLLQQMFV